MSSLIRALRKLCYPNPEIYTDETFRELMFAKNLSVVLTESIIIAALLIYSIIANGLPNQTQVFTILLNVVILTIFIICCRSYKLICDISFSLFVILYGPILLKVTSDSIFANMICVYVFPAFVLYISGNRFYFAVNAILQIIYLKFLYKQLLIDTINTIGPEAFVSRFTNITGFCVVMVAILLFGIDYTGRIASKQVAIAEAKRAEMERQKLFLLSFSHELRNLINSMIGNIQISIMENKSSTIKDYLSNAKVCGELLLHLINNILDSGKIEVGELEITPTPVKIYDAFRKIWGICSQLIKRKSLEGTFRISKNIPRTLKVDYYRLTQILLNLVGNSIKFTERGRIDISVEWKSKVGTVNEECFEPRPFSDEEGIFEKENLVARLRDDWCLLGLNSNIIKMRHLGVKSTEEQGILKITVSDTGEGISESNLNKLFQKFSQVSHSSNRKLGTGLGLFITKKLCMRMGGDIRVYSKRPVVFRPNPKHLHVPDKMPGYIMESVGQYPLKKSIKDAHCLIVVDSSACVTALLMGIPTIVLGNAVTRNICSTTLTHLEYPYKAYPDQRMSLLSDLAYCQWHLEEISSGYMWNTYERFLLERIHDVTARHS